MSWRRLVRASAMPGRERADDRRRLRRLGRPGDAGARTRPTRRTRTPRTLRASDDPDQLPPERNADGDRRDQKPDRAAPADFAIVAASIRRPSGDLRDDREHDETEHVVDDRRPEDDLALARRERR